MSWAGAIKMPVRISSLSVISILLSHVQLTPKSRCDWFEIRIIALLPTISGWIQWHQELSSHVPSVRPWHSLPSQKYYPKLSKGFGPFGPSWEPWPCWSSSSPAGAWQIQEMCIPCMSRGVAALLRGYFPALQHMYAEIYMSCFSDLSTFSYALQHKYY